MRAREMPLNLDATCILHIVIQKIKDLLKVLYFYLNPSDYPPKFGRRLCEKIHVFAHKFPRNSIFSLLRIQRLLISQPTYW